MAETIYLLCAATSLTAAVLLFRMWRQRRARLLLWSCLCFAVLALNNVLLFVDLIVVPDLDLMTARTATAFAAAAVLLFGLIWEAR
jgi:hypothetical protein